MTVEGSVARRAFLRTVTLAAGASLARPGVFAQQLKETAGTGEGPFYPDRLPLDPDNDLLILNDAITPAIGEITHLSGRILTPSGQPIRNAYVEIWEVDHTGSYTHKGGRQAPGPDQNFQGYGRFLTDSQGRYYFRTIKPISYLLQGVFRAPHIHMAISRSGQRIFTSQLLVKGHPDNLRDEAPAIKKMDRAALDTLMVDFAPIPGSKIGELAAQWDVVLGRTASEDQQPIRGVPHSQIQRPAR